VLRVLLGANLRVELHSLGSGFDAGHASRVPLPNKPLLACHFKKKRRTRMKKQFLAGILMAFAVIGGAAPLQRLHSR
jgi:hypothetical protein